MSTPRICLGQQPCGFFPRRFFFAKLATARRLREDIGGEIVLFYHDSDHDPRETQTILTQRKTGEKTALNFPAANKVQRRWSPLFHKAVAPEWRDNTARQLPAYVDATAVEAFHANAATNVADFCLEMYRRMGLLEGVEVLRSGDPAVREAACEVDDFFVDTIYEGEIVRARWREGTLQLHRGGDEYVDLGPTPLEKSRLSPSRDSRLRWMQSVVRCTHYVTGAGEAAYLNTAETPDIQFVPRDPIERSDEAYVDFPGA